MFDPKRQAHIDVGPLDALKMLAANELLELASLAKTGSALAQPPQFDVPVRRPGKILCLGKNYADHARELGGEVPEEPIFFSKLTDTLLPHGGDIRLPHWVETRIDHEIELAVILGFVDPGGRGLKYVAADQAMQMVAGYTVLNDITARRIQADDRNQKWPWLRSKSFDTFCPMGPYVVPRTLLPNVHELRIQLRVNDELRQDSNTRHMAVNVPEAIAFLSKHTTLRPGDILAMGTPAGIGPLAAGDHVVGAIDGLGELWNRVVREPAPAGSLPK